jgi:hypothetical protein
MSYCVIRLRVAVTVSRSVRGGLRRRRRGHRPSGGTPTIQRVRIVSDLTGVRFDQRR